MKRIYQSLLSEHLKQFEQMVFLTGPRQVGKTTTANQIASTSKNNSYYFNWDVPENREIILAGVGALAKKCGLETAKKNKPIIILDELHKAADWKNFLKGFFDSYKDQAKIIVTGSARLDIYQKGGDSLMGRYLPYRLHPFSVAELIRTDLSPSLINKPDKVPNQLFDNLIKFGGFPDPLIKQSSSFHLRWSKLRTRQLISEDLRDLTRIQELPQIELLTKFLENSISSELNYSNLSKHIRVSVDTIKNWINTLHQFYYCFTITPWSQNIPRSLLKQPKIYLWDWSVIKDTGAKHENFIASHLYKAVNFWIDSGQADCGLAYLRDKEKREVDFLVYKDDKPWFLVEVKSSKNSSLSKNLQYYHKLLKTKHAFQVVIDMPYEDIDCFSFNNPCIVPAKTLLSQLI